MRHLVLLGLLLAPALAAAAPPFWHTPPASTVAGADLTISLARHPAARATELALDARVVLTYRVPEGAWVEAVFERTSAATLEATIPAASVRAPAVEYYISSAAGPAADPGLVSTSDPGVVFASAADPHRVLVYASDAAERRATELRRTHGRRARVHVSFDWVDYGSRTVHDTTTTNVYEDVGDYYYRIDSDVTYRTLAFPLDSIRFGFTRMMGRTPDPGRTTGGCVADGDRCDRKAGIPGGGWFETRLRLAAGANLDLRGLVTATQTSFNVGGRAELRFGPEFGSHLAFGGEVIADAGRSVWVRLGWGTVPGFPMAATVERTDLPATHRAAAVRLLYDVIHVFPGGFYAGVRVGYQARDTLVGGATLGAQLGLEF